MEETGRWSTVVIGALKGGKDVRRNALTLIDADIAKWKAQIETAKIARGYITDANKEDDRH